MSYTTPDFADDVVGQLQAAGYSVHEGEADDRPDLGQGAFWFTWAAPGMADCEVGETCDTELAAWSLALAHRLANSRVEMADDADARAALQGLLDAHPLPDDLRRVSDVVIAAHDAADRVLNAVPLAPSGAVKLLRDVYGTWGRKSQASIAAHKRIGDFLVRFNGAPLAYRGRLNPDGEVYRSLHTGS